MAKRKSTKKKFRPNEAGAKELAAIRAHNEIIDDKEKKLKLKHQAMWKKKKETLRGFNG
tara:strand:+ start:3425 stop:3601 length:177 start_codon:yes stop_codon:yes gene_type:complete